MNTNQQPQQDDAVLKRTNDLFHRLSCVQNEIASSFQRSPVLGYLLVIVTVAFFAILRDVLAPFFGIGTIFISFYVAIILVATILGFWPGIFSIFVSTIVVAFFFLPYKDVTDELVGLGIFFFMGGFVCVTANLYHNARKKALQAENALAQEKSEKRLRFHTENSPIPVMEWDKNFVFTRWSKMAEQTFGWSEAEVLGNTVDELNIIYEKDLPMASEVIARLTDGKTTQAVTANRDNTKDGKVLYCEWYASVFFDDTGEIQSITGQALDVTERHNSEVERNRLLAEEERRVTELEASFSSMADGVVIFAADGSINRANHFAEQVLGITPAALTQEYEKRILTPDGHPFPLEQIPSYRALQFGETSHGVQIVLHAPQQNYWLSVSAAPISTPGGQILGAVVNFTDITPLHDLQEQQQLLLHLVSHDLRAPLTIINGYAQMVDAIENEQAEQATIKQGLDAIQRSVHRMNAMIDDLMEMSVLEGGQRKLNKQPLDVSDYVAELLLRVTYLLDTTRLQVTISTGLPPISVDVDQLERIFLNLLSNALKYSAPDTLVTIHAHQHKNEIVMAVSDSGPGIPAEDVPLLFSRYYRTGSRKAEGIGLGLYITRLLVEAHDGRIWVESEVDKGSSFHFTMPVA